MKDTLPEKTLAEYAIEACQSHRGIACPDCACRDWRVKRTTQEDGRIKRERECRRCRYPMTTYELPEEAKPAHTYSISEHLRD